jgi:hypothetical protein
MIAQADERAPAVAGEMANPAAGFRPEWHPLDLHMSAHVIRKANRDARVADAQVVHRRRPTDDHSR